jgi:hypothetical protein
MLKTRGFVSCYDSKIAATLAVEIVTGRYVCVTKADDKARLEKVLSDSDDLWFSGEAEQ